MKCLGRTLPTITCASQGLILQVKGFITGYPCKSLSSMFNDSQAFTNPKSKTGAGFRAFLKYLDYNDECEWVISENVRNMFFKRKSDKYLRPIDIKISEMEKRMYTCTAESVSSAEYSLPQSRNRAYMIFMRNPSFLND